MDEQYEREIRAADASWNADLIRTGCGACIHHRRALLAELDAVRAAAKEVLDRYGADDRAAVDAYETLRALVDHYPADWQRNKSAPEAEGKG
jgi:hypothetical protein